MERGSRSCVLIADTPQGARVVGEALRNGVRLVSAPDWEQALEKFDNEKPDAVVVGYHFDQMRPWRLIDHVRSIAESTPVFLVRALPVHLGSGDEARISEAYLARGVRQFINLPEWVRQHGAEEAASRLRRALRFSIGRTD